MDKSATCFETLFEIRANLRTALNRAEDLTVKMVGPRPESCENQLRQGDSMSGVIADIHELSIRLLSTHDEQHRIIGDVNVPQPKGALGQTQQAQYQRN